MKVKIREYVEEKEVVSVKFFGGVQKDEDGIFFKGE